MEGYIEVENGERRLVLRSPDDTIECKSRFQYMPAVIPFSYEALVAEMNKAIDEEAKRHGKEYTTNEREEIREATTYNYEALIEEFQKISGELMTKDKTYYGPRIVQVVNKYLGKGKKISETTMDQAELIFLVNDEIKSTLM